MICDDAGRHTQQTHFLPLVTLTYFSRYIAPMTIVEHLVGPALLPTSLELPSLSVLTYNVLLPNSVDGWWNYKMYNPPSEYCSWEYRQQLLKERIAAVGK
jgi:mRNA deadenylase 3'-5' endonuclease subunit Ccr4